MRKIMKLCNVVIVGITFLCLAKIMYTGGYALDENWTYVEFFEKMNIYIWSSFVLSFVSLLIASILVVMKGK